MVAAAGHEIGAHGYSHEPPVGLTRQQEEDIIKASIELIEKYAGKRPSGYSAPWWEPSARTTDLLLQHGFRGPYAGLSRLPSVLCADRRDVDQG